MPRTLARWSSQLFLLLMLLGAALITHASLVYFESDTLAPFVIEKLPVRWETLWMASLKAHVAAALVTFPACLALMTRWVQRRAKLHRHLGRVTGTLIVLVLVPSGLILSLEVKGGLIVTIGFVLSGLLVFWGMVSGVAAARRKNMSQHARAMRHVVAQMSVAVTSRAMLVGFDFAGVNPELGYVLALWIPVVASALYAERLSGGLRLPSLAHLTLPTSGPKTNNPHARSLT